MDYEKDLHLDGEVFKKMRDDADAVIQTMLRDMYEKGSMHGKLSISIDVDLCDASGVDTTTGEIRKILIPMFKHSVGSAIQIKNRVTGSTGGNDIELAYDEKKGEYVIKQLANLEQMSIFDDEMRSYMDAHRDEVPDELKVGSGHVVEPVEPVEAEVIDEPADEEECENGPIEIEDPGESSAADEVEVEEVADMSGNTEEDDPQEKNPFGEPEVDDFEEIDDLV